jgi:chromate transporter
MVLVNFLGLYLLLLKATLSSFSGLAALPVMRDDLVIRNHLITDRELNTSVAIGRITPGPKGLYVVSAGYYAAGAEGVLAAWLALVTPALLVIPMLRFAAGRTKDPRVQRMLQAVVLASAGISLSATLPLGVDALQSPVAWVLAIASFYLLTFTKIDSTIVVLGSSAVSVVAFALQSR